MILIKNSFGVCRLTSSAQRPRETITWSLWCQDHQCNWSWMPPWCSPGKGWGVVVMTLWCWRSDSGLGSTYLAMSCPWKWAWLANLSQWFGGSQRNLSCMWVHMVTGLAAIQVVYAVSGEKKFFQVQYFVLHPYPSSFMLSHVPTTFLKPP